MKPDFQPCGVVTHDLAAGPPHQCLETDPFPLLLTDDVRDHQNDTTTEMLLAEAPGLLPLKHLPLHQPSTSQK